MKSLILSMSFLAFSFIAIGQIPVGTKLLGGNIGLGIQKIEQSSHVNRSISFVISPKVGKAVKDNVVNGGGLNYSFSERKQSNQPTYTSQNVGLYLFKQKYLPIGKAFMVFGEGNIGAGYGWDNDITNSYNLFAGLGAGLAYNASNKMLLTLSVPNIVYASTGFQKSRGVDGFTFNAGLYTTASINNLQAGILLMR